MVYITYNCPERFREMTFEELLRGDFNLANLSTGGHGATRTVICNKVPPRIMRITKVEQMILQLQAFNQQYESLRLTTPRSSLYNHFPIPKASGGLRWIDAPNSDLMKALKELKTLFQSWMFADHHTCAFAYVEDRSVLSAAKRHQKFGACCHHRLPLISFHKLIFIFLHSASWFRGIPRRFSCFFLS